MADFVEKKYNSEPLPTVDLRRYAQDEESAISTPYADTELNEVSAERQEDQRLSPKSTLTVHRAIAAADHAVEGAGSVLGHSISRVSTISMSRALFFMLFIVLT